MPKKSSSSVKVFYPRFSRDELVSMIQQRMPALRKTLALKRVVLFGSYAEGRYTVSSDIDLMVIYAGETRSDSYEVVKRTLNIPGLEPHTYSEEEYEENRAILERMVEHGIPLGLDEH